MKSLFLFLLAGFLLLSCKKDDEKPAISNTTLIVGKWQLVGVYDNIYGWHYYRPIDNLTLREEFTATKWTSTLFDVPPKTSTYAYEVKDDSLHVLASPTLRASFRIQKLDADSLY